MKKITVLFMLILFGVSSLSMAQIVKSHNIGDRGEDISDIQEVLKEDATIYPEGYVTGYFGPLTQRAVKKLQKRCGLPETGIIDDSTLRCIFPKVEIEVISPDGGESWSKNQIQTIKWKVSAASGEENVLKSESYIWHKASIDLFRRLPAATGTTPTSVFVKHIATVNLFDTYYSWKITPDIPNSSDYVVRISTGKNIVPMVRAERMKGVIPPSSEIWPIVPSIPWILSFDESNGTFAITGEITQYPDLSEVIAILEGISKNLEKVTADLSRAIDLLKRWENVF